MKKSSIVGLVIVAIACAVLVTTFGQASMYVTFDGAQKLRDKGDESEIHVVGALMKNQDGSLVGYRYDPLIDPNRCEFVLQDDSLKIQKVILMQSKPTDFEKSQKVVAIGRYQGDAFVASKVLLKCPSKYENETIN